MIQERPILVFGLCLVAVVFGASLFPAAGIGGLDFGGGAEPIDVTPPDEPGETEGSTANGESTASDEPTDESEEAESHDEGTDRSERDVAGDGTDQDLDGSDLLRGFGLLALVVAVALHVGRNGLSRDETDGGAIGPTGPRGLRFRIRRIPRSTMLATIAAVRGVGRFGAGLRRASRGLGRLVATGVGSVSSTIRWPSLPTGGLFRPRQWLTLVRSSDRSNRSTTSAGRSRRRARSTVDPAENASDRPAEPASVEGVWQRFVAELPLRRRSVRTPRECATVAVERGSPEDAVETLTETFERVRYGAASDGSADLDRARAAYAAIRAATGGDRS
ncbi:DUF4129 domain-containing protein [Halovivax limisalsi]|uniref:DUF4129 domain-containing protein n=1 Tax=Halovivax limisalsi TaxID=1453760 RepID=UPI001FFD3F74|nr:DUF4129 domain-containing protein [Halovivax limisalsi]